MYGAGLGWMLTRLVAAALGAAAVVLLAACSPGADYPTVLDRPVPRGETLTPQQVKQATDALIADRDHLNAEAAAQAGATANGPAGATAPPAATKTASTPAKP